MSFMRVTLRCDAVCFCCLGAMLTDEIAAYHEDLSLVAHPWCWETRLSALFDPSQRVHHASEVLAMAKAERAYWSSLVREARQAHAKARARRPIDRGEQRNPGRSARFYAHETV